jgi:hypothetical protein
VVLRVSNYSAPSEWGDEEAIADLAILETRIAAASFQLFRPK